MKICDFGLARLKIESIDSAKGLTPYIATRWYRAPEVLLRMADYGAEIDVWSAGCIFAELITRNVLFMGHYSRKSLILAKNQLQEILKQLGRPSKAFLDRIGNKQKVDFLIKNSKELAPNDPALLKNKFKKLLCPEGVDLLLKMLSFDPNDRISVVDALKHPYLAELHCETDEPTRQPLTAADFDFELNSQNLTPGQYRCLLYEECLFYHFPLFEQKVREEGQIKRILNFKFPDEQPASNTNQPVEVLQTGTDWEGDEDDPDAK